MFGGINSNPDLDRELDRLDDDWFEWGDYQRDEEKIDRALREAEEVDDE